MLQDDTRLFAPQPIDGASHCDTVLYPSQQVLTP
jgi:hypothetical protein